MDTKEQLIGVLDYIREVEKLKASPPYLVPSDTFCAFQDSLQGLPGFEFNVIVSGDDVWLKVARLIERLPPEPSADLKPWLTLSKSPDKAPELKSEIVVRDEETGEARTLKRADVMGLEETFESYVRDRWTPWTVAEKPRRKTISLYNKLFTLQQAMAGAGTEAAYELVWGVGVSVWKMTSGAVVKHPLITQSCEIALNPSNFDLEIRPRGIDPALEIDCYAEQGNAGVVPLQTFYRTHRANAAARVSPFDVTSFADVLKAAVGNLDPSGRFVTHQDDVSVPAPAAELVVTDTWVLYARPRSGHVLLADIERLKDRLKDAETVVPAVLERFVSRGADEVTQASSMSYRGLSSSGAGRSGGAPASELYFPMPFNDEQRAIIERLEHGDGVVVSGPPGTGKSHTIANTVCHYIAQGKRVLVTSKGEQALKVLRDKIPEEVRDLTVALLSNEREGMEQFEHSIAKISSEVARIDPRAKQREIEELESRIDALHAQVAKVDQNVRRIAERQLSAVTLDGVEMRPEELARLVLEQGEQHAWLDDAVPATASPAFTQDDVSALRAARRAVGADIRYLPHRLPAADSLPTDADVQTLHRDVIRARAIEGRARSGDILPLADATPATYEAAQALLAAVEKLSGALDEVAADGYGWSQNLRRRIGTRQDATVPQFLKLALTVRAEDTHRRARMAKPVEAPADAELDEEVLAALDRLLAGKSAFALPFGKKEARATIAAIKVGGLEPASVEDWQRVKQEFDFRLRTRTLITSWNAMAAELGVATVDGPAVTAFRRCAELAGHVERVRALAVDVDPFVDGALETVFGRGARTKLASDEKLALAKVAESLRDHLDRGRLVYAVSRIRDIETKLEGMSGPVVEELRAALKTLGDASADEADAGRHWRGLRAELKRLASLRAPLDTIDRVAALIADSGAPRWAERVRTVPVPEEGDPTVPADWLEAWRCRRAKALLDSLEGQAVLRELFEARKQAENDLSLAYRRLVAEKAWLGVQQKATDRVKRALAAYSTAVQAMGTGRGVRADRYRRDARVAMADAHPAVPCWILPQWRVSETMPAEIGVIDLAIVDEASQSDIWALPVLMRAKKVLVVGDQKQVSPSAVGIEEKKINELIARYLRDQPNGAYMTPDRSLYDLAGVVFAGNAVMLKEHFRSVHAIIEYSNREFYQGEIKPLRLPTSSKRLDPPLVDVFVEGGSRNRKRANEPEALAIVQEIEAIIARPECAGRSIGVVTLQGTEQAPVIDALMRKRIDPKDILEREIRVGNPTVFQGDERDIILMSLVITPGDRSIGDRADLRQRFNVAASRARDRLILFRSVQSEDVDADSLPGRLLAHFRSPFRQDAQQVASLRGLCESGFEREMFDLLVAKNYRVRPQVRVGGYRLDFVVEGSEDRRLAIECDGDRFHGPDKWDDDTARQRVLERAGWTFWRCFASTFVHRRTEVLQDLFATLERMGIEPLGAESVDNTIWVETRRIDPYREIAESEESEDSDSEPSDGAAAVFARTA